MTSSPCPVCGQGVAEQLLAGHLRGHDAGTTLVPLARAELIGVMCQADPDELVPLERIQTFARAVLEAGYVRATAVS